MNYLSYIVGVMLTLGFGLQSSLAADPPRFDDYRVPVYSGYVQEPDLNSHPDARTYRTRLRNAARGQVNFAGEYILATWGCGTSCLWGGVIHARTGQVTFLPFTVCCTADVNAVPIDARADSNLIIFNGLLNEEDPDASHYYQFSQGQFRLIQQNAINTLTPDPAPTAIRTESNATRIASSGARTDVTDYELINDLNFDIKIKWLNGSAQEVPAKGSPQARALPWTAPGQSWRIERGAKTWESHWYVIISRQGTDVCSISPRQGESVRLSQLPYCNAFQPDDNPQILTPTCPSGYVLSAGQCVLDGLPTPTCPAGFKFAAGKCVKSTVANPPGAETFQQCVASCDGLGDQCQRELTRLGDAQGWGHDTRQDYWEDTCTPRINACKFSCNPEGDIGPGECRFTRDGGQICS